MNSRQLVRSVRSIRTLLVCGFLLCTVACTALPTAPTLAPTPMVLEPTVIPTTPTPSVIVIEPTAEATVAPSTPLTATGATAPDPMASDLVTAPVNITATDGVSPVVTATDSVTTTAPLTVTTQQTDPAQSVVPAEEQPVVALTVGVNAAFDPFEYRDEQGQLVGFDIELMNALAQAASVEVSFVDMDFNELIPAVAAGEIDVAISAITWTEERAAQVAFTEPYFTTDQSPVSFFRGGQGLAVRTDTTMIQAAADLTADVRVGVKSGTTGDFFVVENTEAQIVRFDEAAPALAALAAGEVEAVVTDIAVIAEFVTDHPDLNVQLMGKPLTIETYAIAVNQERVDLLQILNAALVKIQKDGTYDQIFEKWFQLP
ncbi:MAG: basic amino acid ABC transporter substrate-binding protein [Caldilineaceae bacterium]|nr:basic amino acid ABC transporter substrate-binding protein [Caldilineaceae bacterium]